MNVSISSLEKEIQQCSACPFRNPSIKPLPPDTDYKEVSIMFVGENPSWEEKQEVPFSPNIRLAVLNNI